MGYGIRIKIVMRTTAEEEAGRGSAELDKAGAWIRLSCLGTLLVGLGTSWSVYAYETLVRAPRRVLRYLGSLLVVEMRTDRRSEARSAR